MELGKRMNSLVSEPNCRTAKFFSENSLTTETIKTQVLANKPVYKCVIYESWYHYAKRKCGEKAKLCYMCYCVKCIAEDVEKV